MITQYVWTVLQRTKVRDAMLITKSKGVCNLKTQAPNQKYFVSVLLTFLLIFGMKETIYGAALDVGEPRTIRLIYFLPNDRPFRTEAVQWIKDGIHTLQTFYAEQMQAHGHGNKTFRVETDDQGALIVHRVDGQHPDSHYLDGNGNVSFVNEEVFKTFDPANNVYLIFIDNRIDARGFVSTGGGGRNGGSAHLPVQSHWTLVAHELGHAFGLQHDFRSGDYIMSYGPRNEHQLSACSAEFLAVHPYFNPDIEDKETQQTKIKLRSPHIYPANSDNIPIRLRLNDSDGLHQVILHVTPPYNRTTVKEYRGLAGKKNVVVQFDYDGIIPSAHDPSYSRSTSLLNPHVHPISVVAVDIFGNVSSESFSLFPKTLQALTKISGDNQHGLPNMTLPVPFVVDVRDVNNGSPRQGVWVKFIVKTRGGTLSVKRVQTDFNGRAESTLTLGPNRGKYTVKVSAAGTTVTFRAIAGAPVDIPDHNLRSAIERILGKAPGDPISPAEMATLTRTERGAWRTGINDLTGLQFATNLTHLDLSGNSISDISPLMGLTNLTHLDLRGKSFVDVSPLTDISPLADLINLTWLNLNYNTISNISPLEGLTNLTVLELEQNSISDISPLKNLKKLTSLNLRVNAISDISPLGGLTNLTWMLLDSNNISDILPLGELTKLKELWLFYNPIADLSGLEGLTSLTKLRLWGNPISDISPLGKLTNLRSLQLGQHDSAWDLSALTSLTNLTDLTLSENDQISDISALAGLNQLTALNLRFNTISDISHLEGLNALTKIELDNNSISDISPLAGLTKLTTLNLHKNAISDLSPLVTNLGLREGSEVNVRNNPLNLASINTHIPALLNRGVSVSYEHQTLSNIVDPKSPTIYWTDNGTAKIQYGNLDGSSNVQDLTAVGLSTPYGIALDNTRGKIYFVDARPAKIQRANLDGSNVETLTTAGLYPTSIALDNTGGKMYWTNQGTDIIRRANLDGTNPEVLVTVEWGNAWDIALDVDGGKMYWIEGVTKKIQRANLDGTDVEDLVTTGLSGPRGIALDVVGRKIYWTDANKNRIQRANLDGTDIENLTTGLGGTWDIALDVNGGKMYWTDVYQFKIQRANLDGTDVEDLVTGLGNPGGIALDTTRSGAIIAAPATVRGVPDETALHANYPNPFNPETWIPYQLASPENVTLTIYTVNGQLIRTLAFGHQPAGIYQNRSRAAYWDGRNELGEKVASGVYFYTLTAGDFTATRKMLITK